MISPTILEFLRRIRPGYYPLIAPVFSVLVLLSFWTIVPGGAFNQSENDDYYNYYLPVGQNIANGQGITLHGKAALDYPPGYPLIVAANQMLAKLTGVSAESVTRLSVVLLFAAGALLIFMLARRLWGPGLALLASALWSCYPVVLWAARNPNTELPFSVVFYATLLCALTAWLARKNNAVLFAITGAICGISMLIRPITIALGIVLAILILLGRHHRFRKRMIFALCLAAGNLAVIAPWEIWAYSKTNEIIPLSSSNRASITLFDGLTFAVWNPGGIRQGIKVPADVRALMAEAHDKYLPIIEKTRPEELRAFLIGKFSTEPFTVIKLMAIKTARSWYGTFTNRFETPIFFVQIFYLSFLVLACVIFWRKRPDSRQLLIAAGLILGYFWCLTILVDPLVRYMMPVLGACTVFFPAIPWFLTNRSSVRISAHE
jgi:hypothetical protein